MPTKLTPRQEARAWTSYPLLGAFTTVGLAVGAVVGALTGHGLVEGSVTGAVYACGVLFALVCLGIAAAFVAAPFVLWRRAARRWRARNAI